MTDLRLGIVERKPANRTPSGSTSPDKSAPTQDDGQDDGQNDGQNDNQHDNQDESQLFPPPDTRIGAGDRLIVQGPFEQLARLKETHSP